MVVSLVPRPVRAIRVTRGGLELRRIFPTSLTGDVTSEIAEDDWERGWMVVSNVIFRYCQRVENTN